MAFIDRVVEYPNRITLAPVSGQDNTYDMAFAEGEVTVEGTPLSAAGLNAIVVDKTEVLVNLDTSAAAGTVDGDLYRAIQALGWESEVIV